MISETIQRLHSELPPTVKLVAVSKFHPFESIVEAYESGQRIFAESRPQELMAKVRRLEEMRASRVAETRLSWGDSDAAEAWLSDIEWHFIGHLQTNKLKMVLPYVSLVQSVDSLRLLEAINVWGERNGKVISVLLEPHVAAEETKQGFSPEEILAILADASSYEYISFKGIMGMATFIEDESVVDSDFAALADIFSQCRLSFPSLAPDFTELSIGMSDDYPLAIAHGSTMVRIGSMIFGSRQ